MALWDLLGSVKKNESGGDYTAQNPNSTASGGYGFINATWNTLARKAGYGQYADDSAGTTPGQGIAKNAPAGVQDAVASYAASNYDPNSTYLWKASAPPGGYDTSGLDTGSTTGSGNSASGSGMSYDIVSDTGTGFPSVPDQRATPSDVVGNIDPYGLGFGVDPWSSTGYSSGGAEITNPLNSGSASGAKWWNDFVKILGDYLTRFGLILLALILIGAAAWALAKDYGNK